MNNDYKLVKNTEWKEVEVNGEVKDIPIGWEVGCLTNICEIKGGISAPKDFVKQEKDKTLPFFRVSNLSTRKKFLTDKETKEFLPLGKYKSFPKNSILIAKSGESIRQKYRSFLTEESIIVGHIAILLAKYNKDYLYNLLMYFSPEDTLLKDSTMPALSLTELGKFQIYYPPISQQAAIANILSSQESIIQDIEYLISKYESRFQYLSEELLSGKLRVKEVDGQLTLYKNADDNWKEVEINGEVKEIPKDFTFSEVQSIISFQKGKAPNKYNLNDTKIYPYLSMDLIRGKSNNEIIYSSKGVEVNKNDTLILWDGSNSGEIIKSPIDGYLSSTMSLFKQRNNILENEFLFYLFKFKENIIRAESQGTGIPHVNGNWLNSFIVYFPIQSEQMLVSTILSSQETLINQQKEILAKEKQKFDWLLDNLLSGKYLAKEFEND